jgi:hypothetical protein
MPPFIIPRFSARLTIYLTVLWAAFVSICSFSNAEEALNLKLRDPVALIIIVPHYHHVPTPNPDNIVHVSQISDTYFPRFRFDLRDGRSVHQNT